MMLEFPPFRLDTVNQCLWRQNAPADVERILLTPKEFAVLHHLVDHADRLVTHRELLDAVWPNTAIESQAVKNNIFNLRRALGDASKRARFIETIPRRGYRFIATIENGDTANFPSAPQSSSPPLVGREDALAELRKYLENVSSGQREIVFVTGEPGIGKTALCETFVQQVMRATRPARVARGQCVEGFGSKEAFYPVLDAVSQLCRGAEGSRVVDILASEAPTWLMQFPPLVRRGNSEQLQDETFGATRDRMLREISSALETIAADYPLLLVFEDLQWVDLSTLDVISAIARRRSSAKLMVVGTYRSDDLAIPAPLNALKADLVARQLCRELSLRPLSETEVGEYLKAESSDETPEGLASLVYRRSEGNPLFMVAVLDHLREQRIVEREKGTWQLRRPLTQIALEVPASLREMIEAQIERLGSDDQRVLEVASVSGMSFSTLLSLAMTPPDIGLIESVCDRLARRRQIIQFGKAQLLADRRVVQRYEFTHALYREVLYGRQAPATRTILHRRIGEALETAFISTPDEVAAALAHHFEEGVELEKAVKYLRLAAHTAERRHAPLEAAATLQHALDLTRRLPNATRGLAETEILERLAVMHVVSFDRKAIDAIDVLRARAAHYGLLDMEARALIAMAYPMAWQSAKRGIDVIDQALRLAEQEKDPLARARFRAQCLVRRIWTRGWDSEDAEGCRSALEEIRARGPRNVIAAHVVDCSFVDFCSSQYRKVSRDAAESLAVLIRGDDDDLNSGYARWLSEFTVPWSLLLVGEWGETLRELDRGIVRAEKNGDHYRAQTLHLYQAWVQLHAMDLDTAAKTCESVLPGFQDRSSTPWRRLCLTIYGAAEAGRNNHAHAHALLRAAKDEMNDRAVIHDWYCRLLLQWALANLWLAQGDLTRAREESNEFLKLTEATAERTWQGLAWDVNARVATALGETQRATHCVAQGFAAIEGYEAPLAIWPLHATAARLSAAIGDLGNAERHIETTRATILALAGSLDSHESLRTTFLMAPSVANALAETGVE